MDWPVNDCEGKTGGNVMGAEILNGLLILINLVLGTVGITLLVAWAFKRFKYPVLAWYVLQGQQPRILMVINRPC